MTKFVSVLNFMLSAVILLTLCQSKIVIAEESHPYLKIKQIAAMNSLTSEEKQKMAYKYLQSLSFSEVVSIAEAIRDRYDKKWSYECLMETASHTGPYFLKHKLDYSAGLSEITNKQRPPAWRWLWIDWTSKGETIKGIPTYNDQEKTERFISTLIEIVSDKEDDEHVRVRALANLRLFYYGRLLDILKSVPQTLAKTRESESLKDVLLSDDLPLEIKSQLDPVISKIKGNVDLNLELLKDPNQSENMLIKLLDKARIWLEYGIVDPDQPKKDLKEIFSKRKLYGKRFQRELADTLFDDFGDFSILPELEIMLEEADNKGDKYEAKKLIREFKRERRKRGLEPAKQ